MMYSNFSVILFCGVVVSTVIGVVQSGYVYRPQIDGWLKYHNRGTWLEAYRKCRSEGYSLLASPNNMELRNELLSFTSFGNQTSNFIGTSTIFYPGSDYVSIEGVLLDDMPVVDMIEPLDSEKGNCLSMNRHSINVVSCSTKMPYVCYKKRKQNAGMTECGTFDEEYKLYSTKSCYKLHREEVTWDDAYSACLAEDGYLAVINNEEEATIVQTIINSSCTPFVGLRDWEANGDWMSVHGDTVDDIYNVWFYDPKPVDKRYLCVEFVGGKYNSGTCSFARPFVCEKDPNNIRFHYDLN